AAMPSPKRLTGGTARRGLRRRGMLFESHDVALSVMGCSICRDVMLDPTLWRASSVVDVRRRVIEGEIQRMLVRTHPLAAGHPLVIIGAADRPSGPPRSTGRSRSR